MKNFTKFTGKQLQWACSFTKTGLHNVCCPVNFVKFLIFDKSAVYYQYDSLFPGIMMNMNMKNYGFLICAHN